MSHHKACRDEPFRKGTWHCGLFLAAFLGLALLGADEPRKVDEIASTPTPAAMREKLRSSGLKNLRSSESAHYVALGDAPDGFRQKALTLCEKLASSFQFYFEAKKFTVALPKSKMMIITLADRDSYAALNGRKVETTEGGHYDVAADDLVMFDFGRASAKSNTFTLVHEAMHQLTFDTGLLNRAGDVPLAVSEGLATQGETWQLSRPILGRVNLLRLQVLKNPEGDVQWIPLKQLLTDDDVFADPATEQLAYAESWLLVYELLKTESGVKKLKTYLAAIHDRNEPGQRFEDAEKALGNLDRLDVTLKKAAGHLH